MASVAARRLTEAHRLAQIRIGSQTVAAMATLWPLLDPDDLDGSYQGWLAANIPLIQAQRASSARLAAGYVAAFKAIETGVRAPVPSVLAAPAPVDAVTTSLLVTGPVAIKSAAARGIPLVRAMSIAEATSAASGMRHALNGGRETITQTIAADGDAQGWARVTSGRACKFCSMLAGRGAVYSAGTVDFEAHDGCSCTAEPVYR